MVLNVNMRIPLEYPIFCIRNQRMDLISTFTELILKICSLLLLCGNRFCLLSHVSKYISKTVVYVFSCSQFKFKIGNEQHITFSYYCSSVFFLNILFFCFCLSHSNRQHCSCIQSVKKEKLFFAENLYLALNTCHLICPPAIFN